MSLERAETGENVVNDVHSNIQHFEDDVVVQMLSATIELDPSPQNGSDLPADGSTIGSMAIQENLLPEHIEENQVAELVAVERTMGAAYFALESDTTFATAPGTYWLEVELQNLDERENELDIVSGDLTNNVGNLGDASEADYQTDVAFTQISHGTLDFWVATATQPWKDNGNSNGGGSATNVAPFMRRNYRQEFGRGPIYGPRSRDTLSITYTQNWDNVSFPVMGGKATYYFYWDVYEAETPSYTDIRGEK